jgi:hypothetical protein
MLIPLWGYASSFLLSCLSLMHVAIWGQARNSADAGRSALGGAPSTGMQVAGNRSSSGAQSKAAIDVRDHCVGCTGSAASDSGRNSAASAGVHVMIPQACVMRLSTNRTYALTFEFKQGEQLKPDNGVTLTLAGNIVAGRQQIFANALPPAAVRSVTFIAVGTPSCGEVCTVNPAKVTTLQEPLSDEEVVARVLAGETGMFEIVMRRHNQRLYRVARALLRNDGEAEDVMQDAYVRA